MQHPAMQRALSSYLLGGSNQISFPSTQRSIAVPPDPGKQEVENINTFQGKRDKIPFATCIQRRGRDKGRENCGPERSAPLP